MPVEFLTDASRLCHHAARIRRSTNLKPEHYLLQWNKRVINLDTVNGLIRFLVDGLEFRDLNGHPFKVSTHLPRHVGAAAARHEFGLPLDIMGEILGHTMDRDGHAPAATSYYTRLPLEERIIAVTAESVPNGEERLPAPLCHNYGWWRIRGRGATPTWRSAWWTTVRQPPTDISW